MDLTSSDESTDDDIPIKCLVKRNRSTQQRLSSAMEALIRHKKQKCEFCNDICYNLYDILVHNSSHIMVTLKHGIPRCKPCNMLFETTSKLKIHNETKHYKVPDILTNIVKSEPVIKVERSAPELIFKSTKTELDEEFVKDDIDHTDSFISIVKEPEKLSHFIGKQPVIRCEDTVTRLIIGDTEKETKHTETDNKMDVDINMRLVTSGEIARNIKKESDMKMSLDFITEEPLVNCEDIVTRLLNGDSKLINKNNQGKGVNTDNALNIKSKIIFEDDLEDIDDDIINFNGNYEICDLTQSDSDNDGKEFSSNKILLGNKVSKTSPFESNVKSKMKESIFEGNFAPSVHYEELMQLGLFGCKYCEKAFPNKYQKITHEIVHLVINPRPNTLYRKVQVCQFCDQYIAGNHWNLKRHHSEEHLGLERKIYHSWKHCAKCNLRYYSYGRHFFKYHLVYTCPLCSKPYEKESALLDHKARCTGVKYNEETKVGELRTTKMCEVCALFNLKNPRQQYKVVGVYSEKGRRVRCQACDKESFEVKLLSYVSYRKNCKYQCKAKLPITNEMRLKNIKIRLKKMKLLGKR